MVAATFTLRNVPSSSKICSQAKACAYHVLKRFSRLGSHSYRAMLLGSVLGVRPHIVAELIPGSDPKIFRARPRC